jgi:TolA-binding protein
MKQGLIVLFVVLGLALANCSGNNAEQLFETAKLEELQDNQEHAKKLYQDIITAYPDSPYAKEARHRLAALEKDR